MAIVAIFEVPGMTAEHYDKVDELLVAAGAREPDGRMYNVASPSEDGWCVVDVWESEEKLGAFAEVLMPILSEVGVQPPVPRIMPVYNIIT